MAGTRPGDLWPDWIARGGERSGGGATISWRRDVAISRGSRSSRRNRFETDDASAMLKPFRTAPEAPRLHLRVRTPTTPWRGEAPLPPEAFLLSAFVAFKTARPKRVQVTSHRAEERL